MGERYELIRAGDDVYEREIRADGEARPWRKRSTPELDVVGRAMFFGISSYGFTDPETLVRQLDAGAVEMAEVGSGEVRGVEVTTFRVSLSAARLAEMAVEDLLAAGRSGAYGTTWPVERADYEDEIALLEGIVIDTVVSIGGDGFIRAVETNLDGGELDRRVEEARNRAGATERRSSLGDLQIWYRFELYDFGEPVSIELPDPSEVSDGSDRYDDIDCRVNDSGTYECFEEVGEAIEMEGEQSGNVTIVTDPADYAGLLAELAETGGATRMAFRKRMGARAFAAPPREGAFPGWEAAAAVGAGVASVSMRPCRTVIGKRRP
mgnify:CR=1 FL=1